MSDLSFANRAYGGAFVSVRRIPECPKDEPIGLAAHSGFGTAHCGPADELGAALESYLDTTRGGLAPRATCAIRGDLEEFLTFLEHRGASTLATICVVDLDTYANLLAHSTPSPRIRRRKTQAIHHFLQWLAPTCP